MTELICCSCLAIREHGATVIVQIEGEIKNAGAAFAHKKREEGEYAPAVEYGPFAPVLSRQRIDECIPGHQRGGGRIVAAPRQACGTATIIEDIKIVRGGMGWLSQQHSCDNEGRRNYCCLLAQLFHSRKRGTKGHISLRLHTPPSGAILMPY